MHGHSKRGIIKQKWSIEEDQMLMNAVADIGQYNWKYISTRVPGRSAKQCRERWIGKLNPDNTRDKWSADEDNLLISLHGIFGNQWTEISKSMKGRSMIAVKNRWHCLVKKEYHRVEKEIQALEQEYNKFAEEQSKNSEKELEINQDLLWPDIDIFGENIPF